MAALSSSSSRGAICVGVSEHPAGGPRFATAGNAKVLPRSAFLNCPVQLHAKAHRLAGAKRKSLKIRAQQMATQPKIDNFHLEGAPGPPLNTYKNKEPFIGTVKSVERIVGPNATGETCHIVIEHEGKMPYWEGQSYGIIPPGENPKKPGAPNAVRLYSIASTRYGDEFDGKTASLCIRRAVYWDPELKAEDPAKKGICSNFLCDATPGTKLTMTGPTGKVMLLPEDNPAANHIMVATGTGIAPYRAYLRRMFMERPTNFQYQGLAWLFLGVANKDSLLYDDEFKGYLESHPDQFRYDLALSREQTNKAGGKMYIQDKLEEYGAEVFDMLDKGAHIYFCGLKGMMPGIISTLTAVAESRGTTWEEVSANLKKKGQWHVEVY